MGIVAPKQLNGSDDDCASNLVGSGPFKLAEPWIVNQKLVAAKNADYWQKDAKGVQLPYLNQITFVPTPEASAAGERPAGRFARRDPHLRRPAGRPLNQLKGSLTLLQEKPGRREVRNYLMNAAPSNGNPLADLNARKAVAMAIDRNQVNELRNNGVFQVANGPFDTSVMGYLKNPGFPKYNPTEAKKLVDGVQGRRTTASSAWCSSTPTTRPTPRKRRCSSSSSPRSGSTPRSRVRTRPPSSSRRSPATTASCCGATTPATTPT